VSTTDFKAVSYPLRAADPKRRFVIERELLHDVLLQDIHPTEGIIT